MLPIKTKSFNEDPERLKENSLEMLHISTNKCVLHRWQAATFLTAVVQTFHSILDQFIHI